MGGYLKVADGIYINKDRLHLEDVAKFIMQYISDEREVQKRLKNLRFLYFLQK